MPLAFGPDESSPLVDALLASLGMTIDRTIDTRDEMLAYLQSEDPEGDRERALFQYFRSGASIADSMSQILRWRFGDPGRIGVLDFASGYGRVTRFLVREIPPGRLRVADVYEGGVRFQEERFGVRGTVATIRPEDFTSAGRFDAVLVTSLFTHLPEERFLSWLRVLLGLLAPGGMLVFSVHSPEVLPPGVEMPDSGFCFRETSESGSLDTRDYGSTWVTEAYVRSVLEAQGVSVHRLERGLCDFQDLYIAIPEPGVDFSSLDFQGEPRLWVERAEVSEGRLEIEGWAAVRTGAVREVEVLLSGERIAAAPIDRPRGDVAEFLGGVGSERFLRCGWACSCSLPIPGILLLRVVDARGLAHPLFAGSLDALLLAAAKLQVRMLRRDLFYTEAKLTEDLARSAAEIRGLQARIAAMEASRFWKIRNAWFRVKRALGMTEET
ncbi:MAG TPA: class I SAM-dependent methyltransferase [Thermoanaerobaculia bacterium]|jgi:SAM-dependent methyltransferase|nr:class I SAM-dependent methyltransferase [Thermoanaerobaculia bacterium]